MIKQDKHMKYYDKIYAKSCFSRFFLGYLILQLILSLIIIFYPYAVRFLISFLPNDASQRIIDIVNSTGFSLFFPYAVMYIIAFPFMYLTIKNTRVKKFKSENLGFGMFIALFSIASLFSIIGSLIGTTLNGFIDSFLGIENSESVFASIPLWALTILTLFIAPLFEELIYRKLLMDRIGVYGERLAIIVSGLVFGAIHGTVEQLFYTTLCGFVFAFVYAKTGKLRYSVLMHFLFNFFGGVLPMFISEYCLTSESMIAQLLGIGTLLLTRYGFALAGAVLLIIGLCKGWFKIYNSADTISITEGRGRIMFFNTGCILFFLYTVLTFIIDILA